LGYSTAITSYETLHSGVWIGGMVGGVIGGKGAGVWWEGSLAENGVGVRWKFGDAGVGDREGTDLL
ncbi:hypothetical protein K440DRAFT_626583, partial [Wilcoxina mikolae CBS 423.85]